MTLRILDKYFARNAKTGLGSHVPVQQTFDLLYAFRRQDLGEIDQRVGVPDDPEFRRIDSISSVVAGNNCCNLRS